MQLRNFGLIFFPSLLATLFLGTIFGAGAENAGEKVLSDQQTVQIAQAGAPPLQSRWKLDIAVRDQTGSGSKSNYQIFADFKQTGSDLSGQFVKTNPNACKETSISGTVEGNKVNWTVLYTGWCCRGATMKFEGVLRSPNIVEGKLSPLGSTPRNCTLWWADVVATKDNNLYYRR
ncbi:MAG: hypothetical protein KME19_14980 [Microcoleus vaginatus WJT46-NPBG5]|jgi:hypothetical protein|nr:hypothetical protein [Microcoleus vaginatus WJT46-NPBG5]